MYVFLTLSLVRTLLFIHVRTQAEGGRTSRIGTEFQEELVEVLLLVS